MPEVVRRKITDRLLRKASSGHLRGVILLSALAYATLAAPGARAADKAANSAPAAAAPFAWDGFYVGGHLGYAGGSSNWSGPDISGSSSLAKQIDTFTEAGSFLGGFQGGYNFLLPSHVLLGVEADFTFPAYPDLSGQSTGATANFISPSLGAATYMEAMQASGTARGRVGLRVQRLAALRHGRLRLDPQPADPDADLEWNDGFAFPVAVGLGRRRRS